MREAFALKLIGDDGALAVALDANNGPFTGRAVHQPPYTIHRGPRRQAGFWVSNLCNFSEVQVDRQLSVGCPFINDVRRLVAEEEESALTITDSPSTSVL